MKRVALLAVATLSVSTIACTQPAGDSGAPAQETTPAAPVDYGAVMAPIADAYTAAYSAENAQALAELHADDAALFPPDAPAVIGKEAIRSQFTKDFEALASPSITIQPSATWGEGEFAFQEGTVTVRATLPDGKSIEEVSKYVVIARRQSDGSWKMHRTIWNRNAPPATN